MLFLVAMHQNTSLAMNNAASASNSFQLPSSVVVLIIGIVGFITNGILLLVMFFDPLKCFHRPSMYFVISLAISDFLTGIASCFFAVEQLVRSPYIKTVSVAAIWCSVENSFITILLMAIERLIAIRYPLKAKSMITSRRILILILITWFISMGFGAGVSFPLPYGSYVMFGCLIGCFLIIVVMLAIYFTMIVLLRKSSKMFGGRQITRHGTSESGRKAKDAKFQRCLNMVVFYLALVLIITVLPHLIIGQIYLGYALFYPTHSRPVLLEYAPYISFPLELLNFVLNSVIYAYRLPQFRASVCYYLKRKKRRMNREVSLMGYSRRPTSSKGNTSDEIVI